MRSQEVGTKAKREKQPRRGGTWTGAGMEQLGSIPAWSRRGDRIWCRSCLGLPLEQGGPPLQDVAAEDAITYVLQSCRVTDLDSLGDQLL
jgi:hypothetical protein